ncbi:MAG: hypothetical protein H0T84_04820 [Tatlockia sp.]|nr:hypothetical protein [Tatlockia sp.]
MPIPKIIHFIWAGGEKLLPENNIARIKAWADKNPDFETFLWIDKKTTTRLADYYSIFEFNENPKIILKDITEEGVVDEYSRYHIDRLRPNYGASSDLLRYSILSKIGGAYFDSDETVDNETNPLNYEGLFDSDEEVILKITQFTQGRETLGNDAFICTPNHPLMINFYENAKIKHRIPKDILYYSPYNFEETIFKMSWTIGTTGPESIVELCLIRDMLKKATQSTGYYIDTIYNNGVYYQKKLKDSSLILDRSCYKSILSNEINWIHSVDKKCTNLDEAIQITLGSIHFEVNNIGFLRIDDHVSNIIKSLGCESTIKICKSQYSRNPTSEELAIAEKLIKALINSQLDLSACKLIQLATRYQCVANYYREFTPTLHDGDINNLDALFISSINIKPVFFNNYVSHLYNQVRECFNRNIAALNTTHIEQLAKINYIIGHWKVDKEVELIKTQVKNAISLTISAIVANLITNTKTASLSRNETKELCQSFMKEKIKRQNIESQILGLVGFLDCIIRIVDENKKDLSVLNIKLMTMIKKHLHKFPYNLIAIIATLEQLTSNELSLNNNKIINELCVTEIINEVIKDLSRTKLEFTKLVYLNVSPEKKIVSEQEKITVSEKTNKYSPILFNCPNQSSTPYADEERQKSFTR